MTSSTAAPAFRKVHRNRRNLGKKGQRKLFLEQLEKRSLLAVAATSPVFYLDFDGALGVNYDGPVHVSDITVPAFSAEAIGWGGQEHVIRAAVVVALNEQFAGSNVSFTDERPTMNDGYSTIYVGGDDRHFAQYGSFLGLAEKVDYGNADPNDNAFVFSDEIAAGLAKGNGDTFVATLSGVIAHEAEHLLGAEHGPELPTGRGALHEVAYHAPLPVTEPMIESVHSSSRPTNQTIDMIVIHTTNGGGTSQQQEFINHKGYFRQNDRQVSAHFLIGPQGEIVQFVPLERAAHHALHHNSRSIGIEVAGWAERADTWNAQNRNALATLVAWLATEYDIPVVKPTGNAYDYPVNSQQGVQWFNASGIVAHAQLQPWSRSDPGPYLSGPVTGDWPDFIASVMSKMDSLPPVVTAASTSQSSIPAGNQLTISFNSRDNSGGTGIDHMSLLLYPATGNTPINTKDLYGVGGILHNVPDGRLTPESFDITTSGAGTFNWRVFNTLPAGNYRIKVVAWDNAGNPSAAYYIPFSVTASSSPLPKLRISDVSVTESNTSATAVFNVTLTTTSSQSVVVQYRTVNGTALANSDYQPVVSGSLTIPAGSTLRQISIPIIGDRVVESDEYFDVELVSATNAVLDDSFGRATILNDDQNRLGASLNNVSVTEGNSGNTAVALRITLTAPAPQAITLGWNTTPETATAGSDYVGVSNGSVNFAIGDTFKDITVSVVGDTLIEATERFHVFLKNAPSFLNIDNVSGSVTINDNDRPTISIATPATVTEGNTGTRNVDFIVRLSAVSTQTVTVDYATASGTAQAGSDFTTRTGTVTFNPGVIQQTVSVPVLGDTSVEPNETFSLVLSNPSSTGLLDTAATSATATIVNDDSAALPQLTISGVTVDEGNTGTSIATATIRLSAPSAQTVTVYCQTQDGTAVDGIDYQASGGPITFNPGQTTKTFNVTILNNTTPEPEKYLRVRLSSPTNATIAGATAQVIIRDNDVPTIIAADRTVTEGTGGVTTATFTVLLSGASTQTVQVAYRTSTDGTATAGVDYQSTNGTLTFTPGQISRTFNVSVTSDALDEPNERFYVDFTNPVNANLGSRTYAIGTITDDDLPALPELSINDVTVTEGNSGTQIAAFTIELSFASSQTVTVDYATAGGSASSGSDYLPASNSLTFVAGQTSKTVNVTINGDTTPEATEDFFVNLFNPSNATISTATGRGTITNDDASSTPTISISDATITEGNAGPALTTFTVTLSSASAQTVIVNFSSQEGTATDDVDYIGVSGGLTFNPGQTSKTITVQVNGDAALESDETFFVRLDTPVNALIARETGRGTILNDDYRSVPALVVEGSSVGEGNSSTRDLFFTVRLSRPSDLPVTVDFATSDDTATAGLDYASQASGLTFIPGETFKVVRVSIFGDTSNEPDERLTLTIFSPGNATILTSSATGVIANDDGGGGTIQGRVFNDFNQNGRAQMDEPGLVGLTVYLDMNRDGDLDAGEPTQVTDSAGNFEFAGLAVGAYQVRQVVQAGWAQSFPCSPPGLHQVTNNNVFFDINPQTDACDVTWEAQNSSGTSDIWVKDDTGSYILTAFPLQTTGTGAPQIDDGEVVFGLVTGTNNQIFIRSEENTIQLTNNTTSSSEKPQIDRGQATWMTWNGSTNIYDVFLYNGSTVAQISPSDGIDDYNPMIDAGRVAWQHGFGSASEIMYFNGVSTIQLTTNSFADSVPQIDAGQVTWQGFDGNDFEIFLFNGSSVIQLTNNNYDDSIPRISTGQVTWKGFVGGEDSETFFYDGVSVQQLTNNTWSDNAQQIDNGRVVWESYDALTNSTDIFLRDAFGTTNISNRAEYDRAPQISGNKVVWFGWDGTDNEIFEYILTNAHTVQIAAGRTVADLDFGTYPLQQIFGKKFNDLDGDGALKDGEPGLGNWTVQLDIGDDGTVDMTTITDAEGNYSFADIKAGPFRIDMIPQASWSSTTPDSLANSEGAVGGGAGGEVDLSDNSFGAFLPVTVSGTAFHDANGDGALSGGEQLLAGWVIELDLGNDGSADATAISDANGFYAFPNVGPGTHAVREVPAVGWMSSTPISGIHLVTTTSGQAANGLDFGNSLVLLRVTQFSASSTGVVIDFNRDLDPASLNLYDIQGGGIGAADVTLVGATVGAVRGSVVVDPNLRRLTFIRTAGVLPPDSYTLTLRSAADGFVDTTASLLDGDANGTAGGNYVNVFTVNAPPVNAVTLSVANFARGPQQPVNIPANGTSGLPISFSDGGGITSANFTLRYNSALLNISGATVAPGLTGATVNINTSTPGVAVIQFSSPTPLAAGTTRFVDLQANVPTSAPYRTKHVLDLTNIVLNSGVIPALDDDALHIAAYFGDTTGNGTYSATDAGRISRVAVGFDTGFPLYKLVDPMIIGDISGAGGISSTDSSRMLQAAVGFPVADIPLLPLPAVSLVAGGPDPKLSIPTDLIAVAGNEVIVPVHIDSIVDLTGTGLESADLVIYYDASVLDVTSASLGSLVANQGNWMIASRIDALSGRIVVSLAGNVPLEGFFQGEFVRLHATVKANAPVGPSAINIAASARNTAHYTQLNEGFLTLIPAPTDAANDPVVDGVLTILSASSNFSPTAPAVRVVDDNLAIVGTSGDDRIFVAALANDLVRVRVGNRLLGDFLRPSGLTIDGWAGHDFIYVDPALPTTVIAADSDPNDPNDDLIFTAANSLLADDSLPGMVESGLASGPLTNFDPRAARDLALLQMLADWSDQQAEGHADGPLPRISRVRRR